MNKLITLLAFTLLTSCSINKIKGEQYTFQDLIGTWYVGKNKYDVTVHQDLTTITLTTKGVNHSSPIKISNDGAIILNKNSDFPKIRIVKNGESFFICNSDNENCEPMTKKD